MWRRFHKPPKICRGDNENFTAKQRYYFNSSFKRYQETDDGKYFDGFFKKTPAKIGWIEGFHFYK